MQTNIIISISNNLTFNANSNNYLLQSMTNTNTQNVEETVAQIIKLVNVGADLVRVTVPILEDVAFLREIKNKLLEENIEITLVADVHFLPEVAEKVATFVEKVRINPGNFTDNRDYFAEFSNEEFEDGFLKMATRAKPLIDICKKKGTVIRVGVNQGSLCGRMVARFGNTPVALVESALEWMKIAEMFDFHNFVFSIKSSNISTMMQANLLLFKKMQENGKIYPLHLGVTEAANEMEGRVKSAIGIGGLLLHGLGNTFRVSLTEEPENEIVFSKKLSKVISQTNSKDYSTFDKGILEINFEEKDEETWWAGVGACVGYYFALGNLRDVKVINSNFSEEKCHQVEEAVLQACRIKITKTEIIACPSCGRTQYDIQSLLAEVKKRFSDFPNLKLAVMGCVVNGPGEMADADFGVIGSANGKVAVYQKNKRISDFLNPEDALQILGNTIIVSQTSA